MLDSTADSSNALTKLQRYFNTFNANALAWYLG